MFELRATDKNRIARSGRLKTAHGVVETPAFMPVGTQGTVKAVSSRELREFNTQIVLANTYHLFVRPGLDVIRHFGGLHQFMNWNGPILTDSGGFQIFSLAKLRKITEDGVHFQNHVDGTPAFISPEIKYENAARSMELTIRWAQRCTEWREDNLEGPTPNAQGPMGEVQSINHQPSTLNPLLFGIVQGATFPDLRKQSAMATVEIGFDGYAIGGVSVGEPEEEMMRAVESSAPFLPQDKPRYAMGLGTPPQLLELIARGMDMFDCVLPTRLARNGTAFTAAGTLNLKNAEFARDKNPIESGCSCPACREYARGYIRHLLKAEEILGLRLITLHNLHFYLELMGEARNAIENGDFEKFRSNFVAEYATRGLDHAMIRR